MSANTKSFLPTCTSSKTNTCGISLARFLTLNATYSGNATDDSDIDMAVVVDASLNPSEVETSVGDLLFEVLIEDGELVSLVAIPEDMYRDYDSPFLMNARTEGVAV